MREKLQWFSNLTLTLLAGLSSFIFTLLALLLLRELDEKLLASIAMGTFALLIVWIACERPNSVQGRAVSALVKRLLAVGSGDFSSPAPPVLKKEMPVLANAVESLLEHVRTNIEDVQAKAMFDTVTSLPNRLHFKREGEKVLASLGGQNAAMLFIDLDGFKEVNDSLGHATGDRVLELVAERLRGIVQMETKLNAPTQPVVARLSGDEFTLLFPAVDGLTDARSIGEAVLAALTEPFHTGSEVVQIGASIGVSLWPVHASDLPGLMKAADIAMYRAKSTGRSQVCVYDDHVASAFAERGAIEKALREALKGDELYFAFQPQLCARTGAVVGAEALLRWNHPTRGLVLPGEFIPVIEDSPLMISVGEWVIDEVANILSRWSNAGLNQRLAFNVSAGHVQRPGFFPRMRKAMERTGSPPWLLELEFKEAVAMRCSDAVIRELAALRADGVSIAVDDFGAGYSNFARMKQIPLDRIKLDRSLINDVDSSESARSIVAAMIHLIHGLDLDVVAEGVERASQRDLLRAVGCDVFQGYMFAEAMPEAEFLDWVTDRNDRRTYPA